MLGGPTNNVRGSQFAIDYRSCCASCAYPWPEMYELEQKDRRALDPALQVAAHQHERMRDLSNLTHGWHNFSVLMLERGQPTAWFTWPLDQRLDLVEYINILGRGLSSYVCDCSTHQQSSSSLSLTSSPIQAGPQSPYLIYGKHPENAHRSPVFTISTNPSAST